MTENSSDTVVAYFLALSLVAIVAGIAVWDIYAAFAHTPTTSVSDVFYSWSRSFPPLVLAVGMILGHILWPLHPSAWRVPK